MLLSSFQVRASSLIVNKLYISRRILISLLLLMLSSAKTDEEMNVTRTVDGDLLALKDGHNMYPSYCATFKAQCFERNHTTCKLCRCVEPRSTFVRNRTKCMSASDMASLSCQLNSRMTKYPLLVLSTSKPDIKQRYIRGLNCEMTRKNPQFYSSNGTWVQITYARFSLKREKKRYWKVTFTKATISRMQFHHPARIVKVNIRCFRRGQRNFANFCLVFKIAGSLKVYSSVKVREIYQSVSEPSTIPTVHSTTGIGTGNKTISQATTPKGEIIKTQSEASRDKKGQLIWIISTVLIVVVIVLITVILVMYWRYKKANRLNPAPNSQPVELQNTEDTSKRLAQNQQKNEENAYGLDHIYATISDNNAVDLPTCSSPNNTYQELQTRDRESDISPYQSLIDQELQYVDVL